MSADYSPFGDASTLAGDPDAVSDLANRYQQTANEISDTASKLKSIGSSTDGLWIGLAGPKFQGQASDLSGRVAKAQARYEAAGSALSTFSGQLADAQSAAASAAAAGREAQADINSLNNQLSDSKSSSAGATGDAATSAAQLQKQLHGDIGDAQSRLATAKRQFDNAVDDYHNAGKRAADAIHDAINHDGLKDSWWYRHFELFKHILEIATAIVIVVCLVCAIIACPVLAGVVGAGLAAGAASVATVATTVGLGLAAVSLGLDLYGKSQGLEGWGPAIWDVVSLATFGFGKYAQGASRAGMQELAPLAKSTFVENVQEDFFRGLDGSESLESITSRFENITSAAQRFGGDEINTILKAEPGNIAHLIDAEKSVQAIGRILQIEKIVPGLPTGGLKIVSLTNIGAHGITTLHDWSDATPTMVHDVIPGAVHGVESAGHYLEHLFAAA